MFKGVTLVKTKAILISAYNINAGGGKFLLESILKTVPQSSNVYLFSDIRFKTEYKLPANVRVFPVKNSIVDRIFTEWKIKKNVPID